MPYLFIQFVALGLWFTLPALAAIPLWVILIPLFVVLLRIVVGIAFVVVFAWASAN
jgi:hypothetical protein